jgi:serine/threonine protein kinase
MKELESEVKALSLQNLKIPAEQKIDANRLGPYILGKTIGQGTSGKVKLAMNSDTGLKVAVKIIQKGLSLKRGDNPNDVRKILEKEITIMKLIEHPSIMKIYDVYESSKELFLILEYVEGGELFDYLVKKGRMTEYEALFFFQQIVLGVEYCHRCFIW